jgi:hypothetical protein
LTKASVTFIVEHPAFGTITFVFDDQCANSGFALTDGFVFLGETYPSFAFSFERHGSDFVPCELNNLTSQMRNGHRQTISEVAPSAFRSFVFSKAKQLANAIREKPQPRMVSSRESGGYSHTNRRGED